MDTELVIEVTAQAIGIIAMAFNIFSYQFKSRKKILMAQLIGATLFAVNMFMLDAVVGGILNVSAILRALLYMKKDEWRLDTRLLNVLFVVIYASSYVLSFTVFGTEFNVRNAIVELLPIIGMIAMTFGFARGTAGAIRICSFITSPSWLIYNCFNLSIGGILCEAFSLISSTSAIIRLHLAEKSEKKKP